jgi:hypothetical protein
MVKGLVVPATESMPLVVQEFSKFEEYQDAVGGWIEAVDVSNLGVTIYVNEDGRSHHLPFNSRATFLWWYSMPHARSGAMLVGDVVIVGLPDRNGNNTDIPSDVLEKLTSESSWGVLLKVGGEVAVDPERGWTSRIVPPLVKGDPRWLASQVEYPDYFAACAWATILQDLWLSAQETRLVPFAEVIASRS